MLYYTRSIICIVVQYNNSVWPDILAQLNMDAVEFITAHLEDILTDIKNCQTISEVKILSVYCLVCNGHYFLWLSIQHPFKGQYSSLYQAGG